MWFLVFNIINDASHIALGQDVKVWTGLKKGTYAINSSTFLLFYIVNKTFLVTSK